MKGSLIRILILLLVIFSCSQCVQDELYNPGKNEVLKSWNGQFDYLEPVEEPDQYLRHPEKERLLFFDEDVPPEPAPGIIKRANSLFIREGADYRLSGSLSGFSITVDAPKSETVRLILDDLNIQHHDSPAIRIIGGKQVILIMAGERSSLSLTSGESPVINTLIPLTITGPGQLEINHPGSDGLMSEQFLRILDADLSIHTQQDGLKTRDVIQVINSRLRIRAGDDGIESSSAVLISGGQMDLEKAGVAELREGNRSCGVHAARFVGTLGGIWRLLSMDHGLRSDRDMWLQSDLMEIQVTGDALHADSCLTVDGGVYHISGCFEGLESEVIRLAADTLELSAIDDGLNAKGSFTHPQGSVGIEFRRGYYYIDSQGDGIDCDHNILQSGGTVIIQGPDNQLFLAVDCEQYVQVNQGVFLAIDSHSIKTPSSLGGNQNILFLSFVDAQRRGSQIRLINSRDQPVLDFTSTKRFRNLAFSSQDLREGEWYQLLIDQRQISAFQIQKAVTRISID